MRAMGYELPFVRPSLGYLTIQVLSLPVRACLGVLMNVRRVHSMRRAVQVRLRLSRPAPRGRRSDGRSVRLHG
jgi:hypothetical protein